VSSPLHSPLHFPLFQLDRPGLRVGDQNADGFRDDAAKDRGQSLSGHRHDARLDGCSEAEVELAAEMANAHSFIVGTSDQYKTNVGEKGSQMSGESPFPDNDLSP
jgi:hypothetical protein